ncbi:UPF0122 protein [Clostridia bacterium]|nr:UPF0122 protein [Clostridia bacterium]
MRIEEATRMILLCDFYGGLLTEKQQRIVSMYCGENLSLSEIAEDLHISRQGVHDALRRAIVALEEFEGKLELMARFKCAESELEIVRTEIDSMIADFAEHVEFKRRLSSLRGLVDRVIID